MLELLDRRVRMLPVDLEPGAALPSPGRVRVQRPGALQVGVRDLVVAREGVGGAEHREHHRVVAVEHGRLLREPQPLLPRDGGCVGPVVDRALQVAPGQQRQRERVGRLDRERSVEQRAGRLVLLLVEGPDQGKCSQDVVVGGQVLRALAPRALNLGGEDGGLDGADHTLSDPVLEVEDARERAVVSVRPDVVPGRCVDQLSRDADPIPALRTLPSST